MEITVKDALKIGPLSTSKTIAGHHKLDNVVKGVTIMEAPDIVNWLAGGELLLTSLYSAPVGSLNYEDFVKKLAEKGVAAIAIKVGRFVESVPEDMIEAANQYGLPILALDAKVRFVDVMYPIMAELFNNQVVKLNYYKVIQERFTTLALHCQGLETIIKTLEELIGNPVAAYDRNFKCLCTTNPCLEKFTEVADLFQREGLNDKLSFYRQIVRFPALGEEPVSQVVVPIQAFSQVKAYLTVVEMNKKLQEMDLICLEHAATVVTLDLVKKVAVQEIEQKFQNDLIENLISGNTALNNTLERAALIGWDLSKSYTIVLFDIDNIDGILAKSKHSPDTMLQGLKSDVVAIITNAVRRHTKNYILGTKNDAIILLWPSPKDQSGLLKLIKNTGQEIQEQIKKKVKKVSVAIGIGDVALNVEEIPRSFKEARDAITFGRMIQGQHVIEAFSELGVFRILCKFAERNELQNFVPKPLLKLIEHDKINETFLLKTLEVFLECNGNASKAAKELFIHYKTMLYRLERIKEITGMDLEANEHRLEIEMGLKIIHLLANESL
ncbi:PucR family transcriptional regulator ligand-binding domain-containing protein [Desulfosporosinus sp. PR]|uniref:PucR family transcriptional regulator n=1 Tax=Candidatus Desulfosporosinus nitrosoreducens TaxID=3401928 RepID=UPI0027F3ACF7|nr:PucR family transcriptional regulator ligand-binding domain-containing protein [Desulfosporosinus sp. PR]MDQ7092929.1 PucR family transcriptional regulator ligand-binding domain-containing protein [Desulfosporosinus sp. PR]